MPMVYTLLLMTIYTIIRNNNYKIPAFQHQKQSYDKEKFEERLQEVEVLGSNSSGP